MSGLGVLGGLLGAGGATIYITGANPLQFLPQGANVPWQGPQSAQVDDLRRLVEGLARHQEHMRSQPGAVVIQSHRGSSLNGYFYVACIASLGYVYVRLRGWHLTDLLYVSRASLRESLSSVTSGMDATKNYVAHHIPALQQQVDSLHHKQDQSLAAQRELKAKLAEVNTGVQELEERINDMHASMDATQEQANKGIHLLCRVIGDLMRGTPPSRTSTLQDLDRYVNQPPGVRGAKPPPGLETLLGDIQTPQPQNRWRAMGMLDRAASSRQ